MPQVNLKKPISLDEMKARITPVIAAAGEVIPWIWYDSQTYTSGTTTTMDFFQSVQTDKVLGNMEAAGQIPNPMYFQLFHLGIHPVIAPFATNTGSATLVATGAVNDLHNLLIGTAELNVAQKQYFRAPIFLCPSGGGPLPFAALVGTYTAQAHSKFDFGTNGQPDLRNRNQFWGMIVIPPNQSFFLRLAWTAAITLASGNSALRAYIDGYLYRRVL